MSFFYYIYLKLVTSLLRSITRLGWRITPSPDKIQYIPSRTPNRTIKAHIYTPPPDKTRTPSPVLINFHGSGFIIPAHGGDDAFCRDISLRTNHTVLDIQYRLSPEHPFPAAIQDAEDVVNWVLSQPTLYDKSNLSLSGFSAGGNIALVTSSTLFPAHTFTTVLAFYPSVAPYIDPGTLVAPQQGGRPLPVWVLRFFRKCYLQGGVDARDPRISPALADGDRFPGKVLIITAGYDTLAENAEKLARRLEGDPARRVVHRRMDRCDHGWDKRVKEGTREWELKEQAYDLAVELLQS